MYLPLAILALFAFLFSITAGRIEKTPISGPIIFISFGLLMGPYGLGWLELETTATELKIMADLALAMLLFSDAANVNKVALKSGLHLPVRMLTVGLLGAIALGTGVGWLIFDEFSIWQCAILATMLAATDAALGKAVITHPSVPSRISTTINVESGLNDGLCVPILFVFIALATASSGNEGPSLMVLHLVLKDVGFGVFVGVGFAFVGTKVAIKALQKGWLNELWGQLPVTMMALVCFAAADSLGASGYIAAFSGGLVFGYLARAKTHDWVLNTEGIGETFSMLTWVLFGSVVVVAVLKAFSWSVFVYALLSLTLIRMFPVVLSLIGTGERLQDKLFLAWFGPRGLASIVFAIIVINKQVPGAQMFAVIVGYTVLISVLLHGLTANPLINNLFNGNKK
ncbi:cation:proton antiporter [Catenovulum sp. SM1970]|uniref:cation:proton antiporter n=1 Tax=Marinifaba aquimaris TaxID=2741323 RepID=UPI0015724F8F|nr:cation:proton antiporter [Marinifaba aquimaris]NTS76658.1 cation:proton antiporter [Marinifaba aquimaris]